MDEISVMVCDDSALMRNLIGRIVDETKGLTVCGKAENGLDLLEKLKTTKAEDIGKIDIIIFAFEGAVKEITSWVGVIVIFGFIGVSLIEIFVITIAPEYIVAFI